MSEPFSKLKPLEENVRVEWDLSNYGTKADLKNGTGVETSNFVKMADLANVNSEVDKLDISKLKSTPVDLSKRSDVVKNEVVKKNV